MEFFLGAFEREWERRRAALLHELQIGKAQESDWDWHRRGGTAHLPGRSFGGSRNRVGRAGKGRSRPMRTRFEALARGSQPAVVKLASYGNVGRVSAMVGYIAREGRLAVENERGERVAGKTVLAGLHDDWAHLFDNRADSRDVAVFNMTVRRLSCDDRDLEAAIGSILKAALGDRQFVFAVDERAGHEHVAYGVVVLRDRSGERLTGDAKAAEIVQQRVRESEFGAAIDAHFRFHGYGNGPRFATARVRDLVERSRGEVHSETGRVISTPEDAGDLVHRNWRPDMHSRKGRDVMHLIVSARAGTDLAAFEAAVRDFLGEQFAGHRYVFAIHDPSDDPKEAAQGGRRPHIHAHAIVTMRSETGERTITSPDMFRRWREHMAEKARERGIAMEMTDRREQASAPAYTQNQVRPVSFEGRTEHQGTSVAAQARYDAKRQNMETAVTTERSRLYVFAAAATWHALAVDHRDEELANYAALQMERIKIAWRDAMRIPENEASPIRSPSNMLISRDFTDVEEAAMRQMTRLEFEAYEKRVETALAGVEANIAAWERRDYDAFAAAARDVVNIRREYLELRQRDTPETQTPHQAIYRTGHHGRSAGDAESQLRLDFERAARLASAGYSRVGKIAETDQPPQESAEKEKKALARSGADRRTQTGARDSEPMDDYAVPGQQTEHVATGRHGVQSEHLAGREMPLPDLRAQHDLRSQELERKIEVQRKTESDDREQ